MHSIGPIFVSILVMIAKSSLEDDLKSRICSISSMTVDSAVAPNGKAFVYLISGALMYKLEIKNQNQSVIRFTKRLEDWSPSIEIPIHMIYEEKDKTNAFYLINCQKRMQWLIRYEDKIVDKYKGISDCGYDIESILVPNSTDDHYFLMEKKFSNDFEYFIDIARRERTQIIRKFVIRCSSVDNKSLKLVDVKNWPELNKTKVFTGLFDQRISAAFVFQQDWYLFGGRFYCRLRLNEESFEECKPIPFTDWINDCNILSNESKNNSNVKNKDISMFVIISVGVIIFTVILLIIIVFFITRSVKSRDMAKSRKKSAKL